MSWRLINEGEFEEAIHHALDEVLIDRMNDGTIPPTLRFWYRSRPAVPLGRFQAYADEVAVDYVEANDIDVIRRITGGGAMFVEPGAVITYSMYLPREDVTEEVEASYEELNQWAIDALNELGLAVEHEPLNDIAHPEGKIGGAAQLRRSDAVLHHVTMSYSLNIREMLRVLRIGQEKVSDKAVKSAEKRVAVMRDHIDQSRSAVIDQLIDHFQSVYGGELGAYEDDELEAAEALAASKFRTDDWNKQL
ncbi:MAG: biotin/lipoate A/B protein ligase family protein [Halobacteriales archaeon]